MSVQSVALASLTATYTDSEGEDGLDGDLQENSNTPRGVTPQYGQVGQSQVLISPESSNSVSNSPVNISNISGKSNNLPNVTYTPYTLVTETTSKVQRLVSYFDDTIVSDDEGTAFPASEGLSSLNGRSPLKTVEQQSPNRQDDLISDNEEDAYGVVIPPDPPGLCPADVQQKITNLFKKVESGLDMSQLIQQRKEFRNPSIYEKLIQFCGINELGTNYPSDRFDPFKWGKDSYYEALAEVQITEMKKLEKAKKDKTKIEIVSGTVKRSNSTTATVEEDVKKRKSKWDQITTISATAAAIKPASATQQSLTTLTSSITGTKATVISAFGSLPKKRL